MNTAISVLSTVFVCGPCGGDVLQHGGRIDETVQEIPYGRGCDVHPEGHYQPPAIAAMVPAREWAARTAPPEACAVDEDASPDPRSFGPVTELSARLLAAWTSRQDGEMPDRMTVSLAVDIARDLLQKTKGA